MNFGYVTVNGVSSNVSYRLFFRILHLSSVSDALQHLDSVSQVFAPAALFALQYAQQSLDALSEDDL